MDEERKKYLKREIINEIKKIIEENDYSLEELEEGYALLNNITVDIHDLITLQEDVDDK